MLLHLSQVLMPDEVARARALRADAPWACGRLTAGLQSAEAENNRPLPQDAPVTRAPQVIVTAGLNRRARLFSAALPRRIFPPLFNRYAGRTNAFGDHVDNAIRFVPGTAGQHLRTDISATLFLSEPQAYTGGELCIEQAFGHERIKPPAGDLLRYPGTSVHRVEPVTRGERLAGCFWVESMVRSEEPRRLLHDMDGHLMRLRETAGEADPAVIGLTGTHHNLLRLWADA